MDGAGKPCYRDGKLFVQISTDEVYGSLPRSEGAPMPLELSAEVAEVASGRTDLKCYGEGFFTGIRHWPPRPPNQRQRHQQIVMTLAYYETYGLPVGLPGAVITMVRIISRKN